MASHHCHARRCTVPVPPRMFMCRPHWFLLPKELRQRIWKHYRPGQETSKRVSLGYVAAANEAVEWLDRYQTRLAQHATTTSTSSEEPTDETQEPTDDR